MTKTRRLVTPRRSLQIAKHHIEAALAILERDEDARLAQRDLEQAERLISKVVLPYVRLVATGWDRGSGD